MHWHPFGVVFLSSYLSISFIGNLEKVIRILGYQKLHPKRKLGFYLTHPVIDDDFFQYCECTGFYKDGSVAILWNNSVHRGNFIFIH